MKTLRKVAMAVMSLFVAVSLTACGDDDDDDAPAAPGSGYFTFDGARHDASYGYILDDEDLVDILCFNKDRWHLMEGTYDMCAVSFRKPADWDENKTFTFTTYDMYGGFNLKANDEEAGTYFDTAYENNNPTLTIKRSGNNYEVSVTNVKNDYSDDGDVAEVSFYYNGPLAENEIEVGD